MRMTRWPYPPVSGGFGFPIGAAAGVAVTIAMVTDGGTHHPGWSVFAFAVAVAVVSALTTPAAALGTAVVCWFLLAGFVLGRYGDVRLTATTGQDLVVLAGTAVGVLGVTTAIRALARKYRVVAVREP
jgi:hypothetical protein